MEDFSFFKYVLWYVICFCNIFISNLNSWTLCSSVYFICIWLLDAWYKTWGLGLWGYGVALRLMWPLFVYEVWKLWKGKSTTWHCGGWSPRENWTWVAPPELNGRMQSQRSRGSKESDPSSTERMKESQGLVMRQQQQQLDLVGWGRSLGWRHILNMKRAMDQLLARLCLRLPTNTKNL